MTTAVAQIPAQAMEEGPVGGKRHHKKKINKRSKKKKSYYPYYITHNPTRIHGEQLGKSNGRSEEDGQRNI